MKITAGLGSIDDYISFVEAGAEELFCGYVPAWWTMQYGIFSPLNRREVLYYNVQIGSRSEMEILSDMVSHYGVPVSITLNALSYRPEQYPLLLRYLKECLDLGFHSFIVADFALLLYLHETGWNQKIQLTISGELSEMNPYLMRLLESFHIRRIIFHRKMLPSEMQKCISSFIGKNYEFEAFALNEKCHFHGGFCNSLHCDEMAHICQVPYHLGAYASYDNLAEDSHFHDSFSSDFVSEYLPGQTGCGLCALWDLREAGITHLKLVGRGNYSDAMLEDIRTLKLAQQIMESCDSRDSYQRILKETLFPNGCSGNCYY